MIISDEIKNPERLLMKIDFEKDVNGFQNARKLKMILEHYHQSDIADRTTQLLIESLIKQLDDFTASPEFEKFRHSDELDGSFLDAAGNRDNLLSRLAALWHVIKGPSKRELLLSSQRQELIERAERAEAIAFGAIAETAEVGRQRDSALQELKKNRNNRQDAGVDSGTEES